eukprot:354629-Chlamydomonas_euryale.AAC.9
MCVTAPAGHPELRRNSSGRRSEAETATAVAAEAPSLDACSTRVFIRNLDAHTRRGASRGGDGTGPKASRWAVYVRPSFTSPQLHSYTAGNREGGHVHVKMAVQHKSGMGHVHVAVQRYCMAGPVASARASWGVDTVDSTRHGEQRRLGRSAHRERSRSGMRRCGTCPGDDVLPQRKDVVADVR